MKKLITKLLIGAFIICVVNSCKKDDGDTPQSIRIKKITPEDTNGFKTSYDYDSKGRLIRVNQNDSFQYYEYSDYDVKFIFPTIIDHQNTRDTTIFLLNSNGLVKSSSSGWSYEYDNNGSLIKSKGPEPSNESTTILILNTILNGNVSSSKNIYIINDTISDTITYVYEYTKYLNTIGYENIGMSFFGKQNRNLCSKETSYQTSDLTRTITYSYEFDSKNRAFRVATDPMSVTLFTYY